MFNKSGAYVLITLLVTSGCFSQTNQVDSIWNSYLQSLGSAEKIKDLQTLYYESVTTSGDGISKEKVTLKYPDKVKYELSRPDGSTETIIINGKIGVLVVDNDTTALNPSIFCRFQNSGLIFPELYFKELGYQFSQVYSENDNGRVNILVENGCIDLVYVFEERTSKLIEINPNEYELKILVQEVKMIEGIRFVTKTKSIQENKSSITVHQNYRLNQDIPDSVFETKTAANKTYKQ